MIMSLNTCVKRKHLSDFGSFVKVPLKSGWPIILLCPHLNKVTTCAVKIPSLPGILRFVTCNSQGTVDSCDSTRKGLSPVFRHFPRPTVRPPWRHLLGTVPPVYPQQPNRALRLVHLSHIRGTEFLLDKNPMIVNAIVAKTLYRHQFKEFLDEMEREHEDLLLHNEPILMDSEDSWLLKNTLTGGGTSEL
ncbi:hypothetical protein AVEN_159444-1 [Araneus ventricosus]|uniref:Uncharacterized protein n=1 Tax=Araneus ventricosus TaxID=182803 RepID=A0A4Y2A191_ARAVE|nr:hypothetical protein AVEN_159444-1 [Araneus ventricosus]